MTTIEDLYGRYANSTYLGEEPYFRCWYDRRSFRKFISEYFDLRIGKIYIAGCIADGRGEADWIDMLIYDPHYSENKKKVRRAFEGKITLHQNNEKYQVFLITKGTLIRDTMFRVFHTISHPSTLEEDLLSHNAEQQNSRSM